MKQLYILMLLVSLHIKGVNEPQNDKQQTSCDQVEYTLKGKPFKPSKKLQEYINQVVEMNSDLKK